MGPNPAFRHFTWWQARKTPNGWEISRWHSDPGKAKRIERTIFKQVITYPMMGSDLTSRTLHHAISICARDFADDIPSYEEFHLDPRDMRSKNPRYITGTTVHKEHP